MDKFEDEELDAAELELFVHDLQLENDRLMAENRRLSSALAKAQQDADQGWQSIWVPEIKSWFQFRHRNFSRDPLPHHERKQ